MSRSERLAWEALLARHGAAASGGLPRDGRRKYGNRAVFCDGFRFDSVLEADRYQELKLLRAAGSVRFFLRQVRFDLAPRVRYRADFLVVWNPDGSLTIEDTKGHLTGESRVKIGLVEQLYGVQVTLLKRHQVGRFTR